MYQRQNYQLSYRNLHVANKITSLQSHLSFMPITCTVCKFINNYSAGVHLYLGGGGLRGSVEPPQLKKIYIRHHNTLSWPKNAGNPFPRTSVLKFFWGGCLVPPVGGHLRQPIYCTPFPKILSPQQLTRHQILDFPL